MSVRNSRNAIKEHPFLFGFLTISIFVFAFVHWADVNAPAYKKLDYFKLIVTGDRTIICPQSLLFDIRADHDSNAIHETFVALSNRSEKARELGCEVVRGGIPVTAHRMSSPYEEYVSVGLNGAPSDSFFTMEGDLENPEGALPIRSSAAGKDAMAAAVESEQTDFQKSFPTLNRTMPNLRWFEDQVEGTDSLESAVLVTPYGPCMGLIGSSAGYSLLFVGNYYHAPHENGTIVGSYQGRLTAIHNAEDICHKWYVSERNAPPNLARDSHIWFTPEQETAPVADQGPAGTEQTPYVSSPFAPIERRDSPPAGMSNSAWMTQESAPVEHRDAVVAASPSPTIDATFRWTTQANGDETLISSGGTCATLALHGPNGVKLTLSDGTTKIFDVEQMKTAMQSAEDSCHN